MYRHFPWCMSGGFCILFELEFIWHSWKLPYPSKNIRVDIKDVLLCQWITLKLALVDRPLVGIVRQFLLRFHSFSDEEMIWPPHHLCLMHSLLDLKNSPQCNKVLEHLECNKHPLTAN